jgi:Arc/MetJ family transcription regulator
MENMTRKHAAEESTLKLMHIGTIIRVHQFPPGISMAHTNIDLDDDLIAEAMRLTQSRTKKDVIHLGLRELVRLARLRQVRNHRGKFHWEGNLSAMREESTHGPTRRARRYKRPD